jgi:hypothetical protein
MASPVPNPASLPIERAFVVQFSAEASIDRGRLNGRVEHVGSGRSRHFGSLEELLAFVGGLMASEVGEPPAAPADEEGSGGRRS